MNEHEWKAGDHCTTKAGWPCIILEVGSDGLPNQWAVRRGCPLKWQVVDRWCNNDFLPVLRQTIRLWLHWDGDALHSCFFAALTSDYSLWEIEIDHCGSPVSFTRVEDE